MRKITACFFAITCLLMMPVLAHADVGIHSHFAAFFNDGKNADMVFPETVTGDDIEAPMLKIGAEMMLFTHSVNIQDGDVLNLQNDTLREGNDGAFKDFGLNCALTVHTAGPWTIAGSCKSFITGGNEGIHIIKDIHAPEFLVWYKVFEDKAQGTAGYFMKEKGQDYAK